MKTTIFVLAISYFIGFASAHTEDVVSTFTVHGVELGTKLRPALQKFEAAGFSSNSSQSEKVMHFSRKRNINPDASQEMLSVDIENELVVKVRYVVRFPNNAPTIDFDGMISSLTSQYGDALAYSDVYKIYREVELERLAQQQMSKRSRDRESAIIESNAERSFTPRRYEEKRCMSLILENNLLGGCLADFLNYDISTISRHHSGLAEIRTGSYPKLMVWIDDGNSLSIAMSGAPGRGQELNIELYSPKMLGKLTTVEAVKRRQEEVPKTIKVGF